MFSRDLLAVTPRIMQVACTRSGAWTGSLVRHNAVDRGRYEFEITLRDVATRSESLTIGGAQLGQLRVVGRSDRFSFIDNSGPQPILRVVDPRHHDAVRDHALPRGAVAYEWDDEGSRFVVQSTEQVGPSAPTGFYRTTDLEYLTADGSYRAATTTTVTVFEAGDGGAEPMQHVVPFEGVGDVGWLPGTDDLVFTAPDQTRLSDGGAVRDVYRFTTNDASSVRLSSGRANLFGAVAAMDGASVLSLGVEVSDAGHSLGYASIGVWRTPLSGTGPVRLTPEELSVSYSSQTFVETEAAVFFAYDDDGDVVLGSVALEGGPATAHHVAPERSQVNVFATSADGCVITAAVTTADSAGDVLIHADDWTSWTTDFGGALVDQLGPIPYTSIAAEDDDGFEVRGWLVEPAGSGPHPLVVLIKGGPYTQFGYAMSGHASFEEARYLREAGFAVAMCNPRGSSGRGQRFAESLGTAVAENTERSILAFIEACTRASPIDRSRLALFGGSFGGYMVAWLMSRGLGFAAGIAERGCYDLVLHRAASPGGTNLVSALWGTDDEDLVRQSPITHAESFDGSLMILHSDRDGHAPFVDAQAYQYALARRGKDVELCIAVNGDHELSRSGPVEQRLARVEMVTRWLSERIGRVS